MGDKSPARIKQGRTTLNPFLNKDFSDINGQFLIESFQRQIESNKLRKPFKEFY